MVERIEINLLPAEYRVHTKRVRLSRDIIYPSLVVIIFLFGILSWGMVIENRIKHMENDIAELEQKIHQNRHIQNEINNLRRDKLVIDEKIKALTMINVNREKWVRLMEVFAGRLPTYSYLINIREEPNSRLRIEGRTFSFPEVAHYMTRLKETEYVNKVELSNIEQTDRTVRKYSFSIICDINPEAMIDTESGIQEVASR